MSFPFYAISLDDFETKPKKIIAHWDKAKNLVAYRKHSVAGERKYKIRTKKSSN